VKLEHSFEVAAPIDRGPDGDANVNTGWVGERGRTAAPGSIPPFSYIVSKRRNRASAAVRPASPPSRSYVQAASATADDRRADAGGAGSANDGCAMLR
jgi:hypothetical protein